VNSEYKVAGQSQRNVSLPYKIEPDYTESHINKNRIEEDKFEFRKIEVMLDTRNNWQEKPLNR